MRGGEHPTGRKRRLASLRSTTGGCCATSDGCSPQCAGQHYVSPPLPVVPGTWFPPFPGQGHASSRKYLRQHALPQDFVSLTRRQCFITSVTQAGFTRPRRVPPRSAGLLMPCTTKCHGLSLFLPFGPSSYDDYGLCWFLAPRLHVALFRHKARSPQVRTDSFTAQPPGLHRLALATRASRFHARSPCSAAPSIRFLYVGSRLCSTLPPHGRPPFRSCASLRSLWPARGGTCTRRSAPMLGAHKKAPPRRGFEGYETARSADTPAGKT